MDLFSDLKKFYKNNKNRGSLGKALVFLNYFLSRHKYLAPFLFVRQDFSVAKEILSQIFPSRDVGVMLGEVRDKKFFKTKCSFGHAGNFDVIMLYSLVRLVKPETVVETGVASGRSSWAILAALGANRKGRLYSVDLPKYYSGGKPGTYPTKGGRQEFCGFVPEGKQPGWLVSEELKNRWELILGDAKHELPKLLSQLNGVDIFYHDSDHSYENMKFEFETAWPKICEQGFLLSDDVTWNNAFKEFISGHAYKFSHAYRSFGIILK